MHEIGEFYAIFCKKIDIVNGYKVNYDFSVVGKILEDFKIEEMMNDNEKFRLWSTKIELKDGTIWKICVDLSIKLPEILEKDDYIAVKGEITQNSDSKMRRVKKTIDIFYEDVEGFNNSMKNLFERNTSNNKPSLKHATSLTVRFHTILKMLT